MPKTPKNKFIISSAYCQKKGQGSTEVASCDTGMNHFGVQAGVIDFNKVANNLS